MKNIIKRKHIEPIIYIIIWMLIISVMTFLTQSNYKFKWQMLLHNIIWFLPFFFIFILNNALLAPHLLLKKKYILYFSITLIVILLFSYPGITKVFHDFIRRPTNVIQTYPQRPPQGRILHPNETTSLHPRRGEEVLQDPRINEGRVPNSFNTRPTTQLAHFGAYLRQILFSFLVIGFNISIKQASKLFKEEQLRHKLQEEKLQAELFFLKHQISPHFLMNTLNNIHALVELDQKNAQNSIVRLSHMLRYLLYEKEDKKTSLIKEIEFIKSYTHLMRMRYSENLDIKINIPDEIPSVSIPPFVFITILENAFKYGANPKNKCFIHLKFYVEDSYLVVSCSNSKQPTESLPQAESGGIGLVNTKKRLEIYYGNNYTWNIINNQDIYISTIKIPVR